MNKTVFIHDSTMYNKYTYIKAYKEIHVTVNSSSGYLSVQYISQSKKIKFIVVYIIYWIMSIHLSVFNMHKTTTHTKMYM